MQNQKILQQLREVAHYRGLVWGHVADVIGISPATMSRVMYGYQPSHLIMLKIIKTIESDWWKKQMEGDKCTQ